MQRILHSNLFVWMKTHRKMSIAIFLGLVIVFFLLRPKQQVPIETQKVKLGALTQSVSATGTIQAKHKISLKFLSGGKVAYVGVQAGDTVKKGQIIATLDQRSMQKTLENTLRDYSIQRNTFEQTKDNNNDQTPETAGQIAVRRILENNQFNLDKAVSSVELQTLAKEQSVLVSPLDGIVTQADIVVPGVNATTSTTYTIVDPDSLVFETEIDEADIGKIKIGQQVTLNLDAFPDTTYRTEISTIDFASHTTATGGTVYNAESTLPDSHGNTFREGMNGDAEVILAEKRNVLIISQSAVSANAVYVKTPKGYVKTPVKLGMKNDTDAEIIFGIKVGDEVALSPQDAEKQQVKQFPFQNSQTAN